MLINVSEGEECRIALVEDGRLEELYMERTSSTSHVGNVYKGRVMNVEPSIQAAFVDFGLGRNGFLHISDLLPSYFGRKGDDVQEFVGKKMARRDRPPIQRCLRRGDEIIVQVIKEGIGTKGPTLSAYLSISGKMLVMMPGVTGRGVSKKIEDEDERRRLKQILDQLDPPEDCGFIIRTESVGKSKAEIERDLKYLARLWEQIKRKRDNTSGPVELYTEGDLVTRTVRDVFSSDVDQIIIDNPDVADRVRDVIKLSNPRAKNKVELYEGPIPLFHKYGIEREIEQMYSRHVPLKSGGSLVIDSTEAIVAIDVNSGKNRENSDAEMTAFRTDMEAADEICRQLKLRDLGGVIICDFIDLRYERHRRELEERLHENLKRDRAKSKVLRMSQFGIIEMTRSRRGPSLKRSVYFDCPHCKGAGLVKTPESMSLDVMRRLAIGIHDARVTRVELAVNPDVSFYLQNKKRMSLAELESRTGRKILIRADVALGLDEMRLDLYDNRDGTLVIDELSAIQQVPHKTQLNTRPAAPLPHRGGKPAQGGRPDDRRQGQRPPQQQPQRHREEPEREEFDREMEAIEDRTDEMVDREEGDSRQPAAAGGRPPMRPGFDRPMPPRGDGRQDAGRHNNGAPRQEFEGEQQEGEGGKRRRRRRRRRGRGRGGQPGQEGQPLPQGAPADNRERGGEGEASDREEFEDHGYDERDAEASLPDRGAYHDEGGEFEGRDRELDERNDRSRGEFEERDRDQDERDDFGRGESEDRDRGDQERLREEEAFDEAEDRKDREVLDERSRRESGGGRRDARRPASRPAKPTLFDAEPEVTEARDERPQGEELRDEPPAEVSTPATEAEAPKPKRGRSAGGRGGGRKKPAAKAKAPTPAAEAVEAEAPAGEEAKPKRRRGARGGKGRGRGKAATAEASSAAQAEKPAPTAGRSANEVSVPPVVRTGSTDRHLPDEEPVLHEPVRRPRSYRDLDQIPDDYDE